MQMDLLQEDQGSDAKAPKSNSPKKARSSSKQAPVLETATAPSEEKLPPLPNSLLPPFEIDDNEFEELEGKAPGAFKTISEVAKCLAVPQHVLRFWESRFAQIKPLKLQGGRRYYRPDDIELLTTIKHLLYKQGYTIKGAKKAIGLRRQPEAAHKVAEASPEVSITDKKQSQLTVLRQELIGLREALALHIK